MKWPWSRKAEIVPATSTMAGRGITHFDPNVPVCEVHGIHCDGIAVGWAVEGETKSIVITLTINGSAAATMVMPMEAADMVAASILKGTSGGITQ